jgi:cytochrome c oxidase subunit IV
MSDAHASHEHAGPRVQAYLVVGGALSCFTAISFLVNVFVRRQDISPALGFVIILGVAIVKACLVGAYFMHLKYDWKKVGFLIVPAFILGAMMMMVLMPDIVLAWHH